MDDLFHGRLPAESQIVHLDIQNAHPACGNDLDGQQSVVEHKIPLKLNSVVLADTSDDEIIRLAGLARNFPIAVRFIEKMPFSGVSKPAKLLNGHLLQRLQRIFPAMEERPFDSPTTARIFSLPGYIGTIGIIQGYSRLPIAIRHTYPQRRSQYRYEAGQRMMEM